MSPLRRIPQRGVSLIEALAALAVMAFGMLGVIGMQSTLRSNSDITKQRAEAVRIGQAKVEDWRAFQQLSADPGLADFADIANGALPPVTPSNSNATYTVGVNVAPSVLAPTAPKLKSVTVNVDWKDRAERDNDVRIVSAIAGIAPELAGSLGLPSDRSVAQRPGGRNLLVPQGAVDLNDGSGTSRFTPPNSPTGTSWVFNNTTGIITSICAPSLPCVPTDRFLLSGFIRFATVGMPSTSEGESPIDPIDPALPIGVEVVLTVPSTMTEACYTQPFATVVAYYCAVPTSTDPRTWSGQSRVTGLPVSSTLGDASASRYKVCRYTPVAGCQPTVGSTIWGAPGATASCTGAPPTPSRRMSNAEHPLNYAGVTGGLTQQNFLVIRAGDGTTSFACPGDGPIEFINSNTVAHQPSS